jgi:hypothetical protein
MRVRVAIVGYGNLGAACVRALRDSDPVLAGVVRRSPGKLPAPFAAIEVVTHLRDLGRVDAVLLCVPATEATAAARDILQLHLPLVECAILDGAAARAHYEAIATATRLQAALDADPLFAGARTLLFPVESVARLEHAAHGMVFERRAPAAAAEGRHAPVCAVGRRADVTINEGKEGQRCKFHFRSPCAASSTHLRSRRTSAAMPKSSNSSTPGSSAAA